MRLGQRYLDTRSGVSELLPDEKPVPRVKVLTEVIGRLEDAVTADPADARLWTDLANWYSILYETTSPPNDNYRKWALQFTQTAQTKDPLGEDGYLAESRLHELAATRVAKPADRGQEQRSIPRPLLIISEKRPNEAQLHYRAAVALMEAKQPALGKIHAARALELDAAAPPTERPLSNAQRQQAERFAKVSP